MDALAVSKQDEAIVADPFIAERQIRGPRGRIAFVGKQDRAKNTIPPCSKERARNDGPAMATADVAIAMGRGGSDLAVETADVILVHDDIAAIPATVDLARRAHRVVKANIVFAACVILALVTWDFVGHLPLPLGVAGHEGSTVVVGLNGLRLLRRSVWRRAAR